MNERYICILDFEATCWNDAQRNDQTREIIEFPSILYKVDWKNNVTYIDKFSQYVKPVINPQLSQFCINLTGITQLQVDNALDFLTVYKNHCKWVSSHVPNGATFTFITVGKWDLSIMLPIEANRHNIKLNNFYRKWKDLKYEFNNFYNKSAGSMMDMLKKLNIEHTGRHHSGISDCENIAKIVLAMIKDGCSFV